MINWHSLHSPEQIEAIMEDSHHKPCIIFKHSTSCGVSDFVQMRLEEEWDFPEEELSPFFLDVIANRSLARLVAEKFDVHHESPQLLLIRKGECTYDASHLDVRIEELHECFYDTF